MPDWLTTPAGQSDTQGPRVQNLEKKKTERLGCLVRLLVSFSFLPAACVGKKKKQKNGRASWPAGQLASSSLIFLFFLFPTQAASKKEKKHEAGPGAQPFCFFIYFLFLDFGP